MNDNLSTEKTDRELAREEAELLKKMPRGGVLAREFLKLEEEVEILKNKEEGKSWKFVIDVPWSIFFLIVVFWLLFK